MNTASDYPSELALSGVSAKVHRFKREITPAQEGLLDCCSHIDAQELVHSLNWMLTRIREGGQEGLTAGQQLQLALVSNLKDWLSDLVDECRV